MDSIQQTNQPNVAIASSPLCHCNKATVEDCSWTDIDHPCRRFLRCPKFNMPSGCSFKQFIDEGLTPYYKDIINDILSKLILKAKEIETLKGCKKKFQVKLKQNNIRWAARMAKACRKRGPVRLAGDRYTETCSPLTTEN